MGAPEPASVSPDPSRERLGAAKQHKRDVAAAATSGKGTMKTSNEIIEDCRLNRADSIKMVAPARVRENAHRLLLQPSAGSRPHAAGEARPNGTDCRRQCADRSPARRVRLLFSQPCGLFQGTLLTRWSSGSIAVWSGSTSSPCGASTQRQECKKPARRLPTARRPDDRHCIGRREGKQVSSVSWCQAKTTVSPGRTSMPAGTEFGYNIGHGLGGINRSNLQTAHYAAAALDDHGRRCCSPP